MVVSRARPFTKGLARETKAVAVREERLLKRGRTRHELTRLVTGTIFLVLCNENEELLHKAMELQVVHADIFCVSLK